jgi:hypothetical protein
MIEKIEKALELANKTVTVSLRNKELFTISKCGKASRYKKYYYKGKELKYSDSIFSDTIKID